MAERSAVEFYYCITQLAVAQKPIGWEFDSPGGDHSPFQKRINFNLLKDNYGFKED
jgi:hypothetical protein